MGAAAAPFASLPADRPHLGLLQRSHRQQARSLLYSAARDAYHGERQVDHQGGISPCSDPASEVSAARPRRSSVLDLDGRREALLRIGAAVASLLGSSLSVQTWQEAGASELGLGSRLSEEEDDPLMPDPSITDRVFLDITMCPSIFNTGRENGRAVTNETGAGAAWVSPLPSSSSSSTPPLSPSHFHCDDGQPLGRIVIGLYGKQVPQTVANFKAMCNGSAGSSYKGCLIHRTILGQYIMAGKQGSSRGKGEVLPPTSLDRNPETINPAAFKLSHLRPGTVSLCLSENDDEDQFKLSTGYRNVEFLITTGPGPAPQLDNRNIVFGRVLEGLDVVRAAAAVPVYKPSERIRQLNEIASFIGDERASNARNFWYRPLKAMYIRDCGIV